MMPLIPWKPEPGRSKIFTGPRYDQQVAIGETATFDEAKAAAEVALRKLTAAPARPVPSPRPARDRDP